MARATALAHFRRMVSPIASWLSVRAQGLYCEPADLFIDPVRPVPRAAITHAHADHARPGHQAVLATAETLAIMRVRLGASAGAGQQALAYATPLSLGPVTLTLFPAGHVLGSAQILLQYQGSRALVSGDYKRQPDPTCASFQPVPADVFITEATFGLPVFRHPPAEAEIVRLLASLALFPGRAHLIGCYSLGKCQRLIALLREAGYDAPIYLHGAHASLCALYESLGVGLGDLRPATGAKIPPGAIVLAPPSALADRWSRRLPDPLPCLASGWMRVRARARQSGAELPLIISDHADWDALLATIAEIDAPEVWVTHGREDALIHAITTSGRAARALRLIGYEDDAEDTAPELPAP